MIYVLSHSSSWVDGSQFLFETHFDLGDCHAFEGVIKRLAYFRFGDTVVSRFAIVQKFDCVAERVVYPEPTSARQGNPRYCAGSCIWCFYDLGGELHPPEEDAIVDSDKWRTLFADIGLWATAELFWQWSTRFPSSRVARMANLRREYPHL